MVFVMVAMFKRTFIQLNMQFNNKTYLQWNARLIIYLVGECFLTHLLDGCLHA